MRNTQRVRRVETPPPPLKESVTEVFETQADDMPGEPLEAFFPDQWYPHINGQQIDDVRCLPYVDLVERFSDGQIFLTTGWKVKFRPYNDVPEEQRPHTITPKVLAAIKAMQKEVVG
jgi:hypothetical protein